MRTKAAHGISLLAAFLLPTAVMWLVFQYMGFAPAGDKSVLIMDMHNQYAPFFASLRALVEGDASLFFSFEKAMGTSFVGLFAYYIASPLNLLTLLFPARNLPLALTLLTCIKLGLCGVSMQTYLLRARKLSCLPALIISCGWALMSYNVVYGMCLMWLDAVALTPLVLWGVEKLAAGKRPVQLLICLLLLFWCDYYLGYMIGLFSVLYLLWLLCAGEQRPLRTIRAIGRLAGTAAAAIGLLAFYILPVGLDLIAGKISGNGWRPDSWYYFPPWQLGLKLLPGNYTSITYNGLPSLFCGTVPLIAALCWLAFGKDAPPKKRIATAGLLLLLAASFTLCGLDWVWHGFQFPNWFPARYAFLWSFMIAVAAAGFAAGSFVRRWQQGKRQLIYYAVCALCFVFSLYELGHNAAVQIAGLDEQFGYRSTAAYTQAYDKTVPLTERLKAEGDFYRIEKTYQWSQNDALLYSYNGISHYSSTYHGAFNRFSEALGLNQRYFWNSYFGSTPVTDALLNVRYVLSETALPIYTAVDENAGVTAYENPFVLPVAFAADAKTQAWQLPAEEIPDPFAAQESLLTALCGHETAVWQRPPVQEVKNGNIYIFTVTMPSEGELYAALPAGSSTGASGLYVNSRRVMSDCLSADAPRVMPLGRFAAGETVTVMLSKNPYADLAGAWFAVLDEAALKEETATLKTGGMTVEEVGADSLSGELTAKEGQVLFVSLPYSGGFTVTVDGAPVETFAVGDSLLGAKLSAGTHRIEIRYTAPGFFAGLAVSLLTALGLAGCGVYGYIRRKRVK